MWRGLDEHGPLSLLGFGGGVGVGRRRGGARGGVGVGRRSGGARGGSRGQTRAGAHVASESMDDNTSDSGRLAGPGVEEPRVRGLGLLMVLVLFTLGSCSYLKIKKSPLILKVSSFSAQKRKWKKRERLFTFTCCDASVTNDPHAKNTQKRSAEDEVFHKNSVFPRNGHPIASNTKTE